MTENKHDPTKVNSFKIPQQPKAKRNEPGYWSRKNLGRVHEVKEKSHADIEAEQLTNTKEVLNNE